MAVNKYDNNKGTVLSSSKGHDNNDFYLKKGSYSGKKDKIDDKKKGPNAYTKQPYAADTYSRRGVWDLTNPFQFAPYETGYCMLAVLSSPSCMFMSKGKQKDENGKSISVVTTDTSCYNYNLQKAFVYMLENEFKGLDGIEDITAETSEFSDGISSTSRITKVNQPLQQTISMRYTEKTGSLITKYLSTYLRTVKDPRTQAKTYAVLTDGGVYGGFNREVFNMLYIITDSTCLRVEKAFLLLNAFPTSAPYSEMYNMERGSIEGKEITINFMANVVDGAEANRIAYAYLRALVNLKPESQQYTINLNSSDFNYSFADEYGKRRKIKDIKVRKVVKEKDENGEATGKYHRNPTFDAVESS